MYEEVLVFRENVEKGTIIEASMLATKKINIDEDYIAPDKKNEIVGMQADGFIQKGVPVFSEYFQNPNLTPDEQAGRYGFALSAEWIASKPETLSRGDKVFLFFGKKLVTEADVVEVSKDGSVEIIVGKEEAAAICQVTESGGHLALIYQ